MTDLKQLEPWTHERAYIRIARPDEIERIDEIRRPAYAVFDREPEHYPGCRWAVVVENSVIVACVGLVEEPLRSMRWMIDLYGVKGAALQLRRLFDFVLFEADKDGVTLCGWSTIGAKNTKYAQRSGWVKTAEMWSRPPQGVK